MLGPGGARAQEPYCHGVSKDDQLAEACASAMYERDRASQALGITIEHVAPGRATARMTLTPTMANGYGIAHGGYVFLLADTAFAFACNTYDQRTVAAGGDIVFVAPASPGDELVAEAVERIRSGRSGVYDITVRRTSDAMVIAEMRGRSRTTSGTVR
jgi:acyl-CoA thioesterase